MTVFTEGRHAAEFIMSEAGGMRSRENGIVVTGQNLVAGQVVQLAAGKLTAFTAAVDTDGNLLVEAAGIVIYAADATSSDVEVAYLARDAEVNGNIVTLSHRDIRWRRTRADRGKSETGRHYRPLSAARTHVPQGGNCRQSINRGDLRC